MNAERSSIAQRLSLTTINTLPQNVIEAILCLLPIEEAARPVSSQGNGGTNGPLFPNLSLVRLLCPKEKNKEKLPSDIASARKNMDERCKLFNAIHQVLLMRQGPIHEFTFNPIGNGHCFELDQIIFHLSRNHAVKKLTLIVNYYTYLYKLPLCAFSLHQLTDLDLHSIVIDHQPIFSGFGSLRSLCLCYVYIKTKALLHLLSNCPSLKRFTLQGFIGHKDCTIIELFDCLHVIEDLTIYGRSAHHLVLDSVPEELSTSLIHLKYFCFKEMSLDDDHHLTFLAVLLKCSPNLEHIELEAEMEDKDENEIYSRILEKYSGVWLEHLKELVIDYLNNSKPSMEFVKFIMARSPKLKKVLIGSVVEKDEVAEMLKVLLQAPHASPVEIVVK